jgi:hypothetical protein
VKKGESIMKFRLLLLVTALAALLAVGTVRVFADLGVYDEGKSGMADFHMGDVYQRVIWNGAIGDQKCDMPADNSAYGVSENASLIKFTFHWRFVNQKGIGSQRFTAGYRIYKSDGSGGWTELAKSDRKVDKTIGANGQESGACSTPDTELSGSTKFKVMVLYDIYGKNATSKTRIITIEPSLPAS